VFTNSFASIDLLQSHLTFKFNHSWTTSKRTTLQSSSTR